MQGAWQGSAPIFDHLQRAIAALTHTGAAGFEGFVRDLLAEVSGQQFRLVKSGPQGGVDAVANESATRIQIGMEGKHYRETTRLRLDELKSKLRDAADTYPDLDLWVLATSRGIDAGDKTALDGVGEALAIDVLVADWAGHGAALPPLATLCAAAPTAVAHHLGYDVAIVTDLEAIRQHPSLAGECERLRDRLNSASTGLDAARQAIAKWTRAQMHDVAAAKVAFDSYATLEKPGVSNIVRPSLDAAIDGWWTANTQAPLALVGGEGMGKTWQILNWWRTAADRHEQVPLTIVVPARSISGSDGPTIIAEALARVTELRTPAFWLRRLRRWASADTSRPLILLIIDGLNQHWQFNGWQDLLLSLQTPRWRNRVAVAVTCRPDHWHQRLRSLPGLVPEAQVLPVGPFDDAEVDALLSTYGLSRSDFSPSLLPLLRVPRLSRIAVEQRERLVEGEITAARLIYEDWRGRGPGSELLGDGDFREFVAELGRTLRAGAATLTREQLLERLDADSGRNREHFEGVLSELIDGGWLRPTGERNRFELVGDRMPAALALTLIAELRSTASGNEATEIIGPLLDPYQALDVSVAILRHATTFAMIDQTVSSHVRRTLVHEWLSAQNFSGIDFEEFWRLLGCGPELILDLVEHYWFENEPAPRADEVIVKAFSNAFKWPTVADAVTRRLLQWFSRYWLDPLRGEVLGEVPDDEDAAARREATRARAATAGKEGVFERFGLVLEQAENGRQAWGCYRAVELMSWLPRAPLIDVFTAWALTRSVLGGFRQHKPMYWVLRWNRDDSDASATAIMQRAAELAATGGAIAREAARTLLEALATPAAHRLLGELFGPDEVEFDDDELWPPTPDYPRYANAPLQAVDLLHANPCDPQLALPTALVERLQAAADALTPEQKLARDRFEDGGFETARLALARWAPDRLANIVRERFRCPSLEQASEQITAANDLAEALLVLPRSQVDAWQAFSAALPPSSPNGGAHIAQLFETDAAVQIDVIERLAPGGKLPSWASRLLAQPSSADFDCIAAHLASDQSDEALLFWLNYLQAIEDLTLPVGWRPLGLLVGHHNTAVRAGAMQLALWAEDTVLADALFASGWSCASGMERPEAAYGSLLLAHATAASTGGVINRVHPEALGELADRYPDHEAYLVAFAEYVRDELHHLATSTSRAYPRALLAGGTRGWDALLARYGAELVQWTQPLADMTGAASFHLFAFAEQFPLLQALDVRERLVPGAKGQLVTAALRQQQSSSMRIGNLYSLAADLSGPAGEEARSLALAEANNDQKLFEFAGRLQDSGQTDWLVAQIERDLTSPNAATIARGLTLAGQLWPSEQADALWIGILATAPAPGWLDAVRKTARNDYRRMTWAQEWYEQYHSSSSDDLAYAAYELFVASLDERAFAVARPSRESIMVWPLRRRLHWSVEWPRVTKRVKEHKDALAKLYLATELPLSTQAPRCS